MSPVRITRRDALRLTLAAATATAARHPVLAAPPAWQEAPSLAEASKGGKLPDVGHRLPTNPEIVQPAASVGSYGGVMRTAVRGDADHNAILRIIGNMGLTRWSPDFARPIPNVAESWTTNADASVYTFKLRAGMRWSDGHPFTADDIIFFTDDLLANREFYASPPPQYVINGELMRGEKVDDATVRLIFAGPYLTFPERLAGPLGQHPILYAKHYCSQFMPKYNPDVGKLLARRQPAQLVGVVPPALRRYRNPGAVGQPGAPDARSVGDHGALHRRRHRGRRRRNPYFWQVDPAGKQLPYLDAVNFKVISDIQSIVLAAVGGQMDLEVRHVALINNKPVLAQHAKSGQYGLTAVGYDRYLRGRPVPQSDRQEPGAARAADQPRVPPRAVARDRSRRDQRDRVPRPEHAMADQPAGAGPVLQQATRDAVSSSRTWIPRTRSSTNWG